jgi:hypothetical protein
MATLWSFKKCKILYKVFCFKKFAKYGPDPYPDLDTKPEPKIFHIRNRNKYFRFHNTDARVCFLGILVV